MPEKHANEMLDKANGQMKIQQNGPSLYFGLEASMVIKAQNGFVKGRTFDGKTILIYTRDNVELSPIHKVNTWLYIVSKGTRDISKCDGISFKSGVLRSLFVPHSLRFNYELDGNDKPVVESENSDEKVDEKTDKEKTHRKYVEFSDDSLIVEVNDTDCTDRYAQIKAINISSPVMESYSINEGAKLGNDGVVLDLLFNGSENVEKTFQKSYYDILTLCQFMAYRKNVAFEEVYLLRKSDDDHNSGYIELAECYIKPSYDTEKIRDSFRCITFDQLQNHASDLFKLVRTRESGKSKFVVNFIPESHKDAGVITDRKIRDVCTSIELEASLNKIHAKSADAFCYLVNEIKNVINESKKSMPLSKREYDYIEGNISHWEAPAAELEKALFDKYKADVEYLMRILEITDLSEEKIQKMVKVRNQLTHGGGVVLDDDIVNTIVIMMGVVYASVLSRSGCKTEQIKNWIQNGLMTVMS